jgi:hypothetical protein
MYPKLVPICRIKKLPYEQGHNTTYDPNGKHIEFSLLDSIFSLSIVNKYGQGWVESSELGRLSNCIIESMKEKLWCVFFPSY